MDEPAARSRQSSRRMASAKSTSTTRRSSSSKSSSRKGEQEVSPARWAGVAFVITAIVAAIVLAMVSPSDPGTSAPGVVAEASPAPSPTALNVAPPAAKPTIVNPIEGTTGEFIIPVTVELPKEELPRKSLRLLIMRGDEVLKRKDDPKNPATITVEGVEVAAGQNELTAVLIGDGGPGPRSDPVVLTVDEDKPDLEILEPPDKHQTFEKTIQIAGTSEVGAEVVVVNTTNNHEAPYGVVGSGGDFEVTVPLKRGVVNKIEARSVDEAGIPKIRKVRVTRVDGRPRFKVKAPESIDRSELPTALRIVVDVTDAKDKPMPDAEVYFSLGGPGYVAMSDTVPANADGRAVWKPTVGTSSSSPKALELTVEVTSSLSDETSKPKTEKIPFE